MRAVLLFLISLYRRVISPLKSTPSCRFLPTCSEFAHTAIQRHGALRGGSLAVCRVLRCNPLFHGGVHEVPPLVSRRVGSRPADVAAKHSTRSAGA